MAVIGSSGPVTGATGRVALVTGASSGIGAATARRMRVVVNYLHSSTAAEEVVAGIEAAGGGGRWPLPPGPPGTPRRRRPSSRLLRQRGQRLHDWYHGCGQRWNVHVLTPCCPLPTGPYRPGPTNGWTASCPLSPHRHRPARAAGLWR